VALVELLTISFHPKKVWAKKNYQKKQRFTVFNKIPKLIGFSFG
jgi:hypothetical protein